jgi:hypothetical protein
VGTGPDPLGKRALFWLPVEEEAVVIDPNPLTGRSNGTSGRAMTTAPHPRPAGKRALYSEATPDDEPLASSTVIADDPIPPRGLLAVDCSSCGSVTIVRLVDFVLLHVPFGAWVPFRTFDRWIRCPACRRRTWTSVTLSGWS